MSSSGVIPDISRCQSMDHGCSSYHGDDRQGVPLTDGIIASSAALKRKEGEHEQMLVPDERLTVAYFFFFEISGNLSPTKECSSTRHPCTRES